MFRFFFVLRVFRFESRCKGKRTGPPLENNVRTLERWNAGTGLPEPERRNAGIHVPSVRFLFLQCVCLVFLRRVFRFLFLLCVCVIVFRFFFAFVCVFRFCVSNFVLFCRFSFFCDDCPFRSSFGVFRF